MDAAVQQAAGPTGSVGAVLALKPLSGAKTRLQLPAPVRRRLALLMFIDTLRAIAEAVDHTVVISREDGLAGRLRRAGLEVEVLADEGDGLNEALEQGERRLARLGLDRVLACVGDLPALQATDVRAVLDAAHSRSHLADHDGVGTTMLIAAPGRLDPRFQGPSSRAHAASGAVALSDSDLGGARPGARRDGDTVADLIEAASLGLGAMSRTVIDPATGRVGDWQTVTVAESGDDRHRPLSVITETGHRLTLRLADVHDHPVRLRAGQRLQVVVGSGRVLTAWWYGQ